MKEVKIVKYTSSQSSLTEEELTDLVNEGWEIVAAGAGFVVLQRER